MTRIHSIVPCLWFEHQAQEAAGFYVSIFERARIRNITRYSKAGQELHGQKAGAVLSIEFELQGVPFTALNGGSHVAFNPAVSLQVMCETQDAVDHYWKRLSAGGDDKAQQCGWLKDQFGVSWQIVPTVLSKLLGDPDAQKAGRALNAMLQMKKLDIAKLRQAFTG